jgi:hypothetical protein
MIRDIWIFLFALGFILFNWPIISIFNYGLSQYLFITWFVFIAVIFTVTVYLSRGDRGG